MLTGVIDVLSLSEPAGVTPSEDCVLDTPSEGGECRGCIFVLLVGNPLECNTGALLVLSNCDAVGRGSIRGVASLCSNLAIFNRAL